MYFPAIIYKGDFSSWQEAQNASTGYESDEILSHIKNATDRVLAGDAAFERDGVTFLAAEYPYHLIAPMLLAALKANGRLSVLDFGGSLGSTYRQCRPILTGISSLAWNVIEQDIFVSAGRNLYQTDELIFHRHIGEVEDNPNLLLFSGVLQYLSDPLMNLKKVIERTDAAYLIVNRTPFWHGVNNRILVQEVPSSIYPASYPLWIFSHSGFLAELANGWSLVDDTLSDEGAVDSKEGLIFEYHNLIFRKRAC